MRVSSRNGARLLDPDSVSYRGTPKVCGFELETISFVSHWVKKSGHSKPVRFLSWPNYHVPPGESEIVHLSRSAGSRLKSDIESYGSTTKTMSKALDFRERKRLSTVGFDYSLARSSKFFDIWKWFFNTLTASSVVDVT